MRKCQPRTDDRGERRGETRCSDRHTNEHAIAFLSEVVGSVQVPEYRQLLHVVCLWECLYLTDRASDDVLVLNVAQRQVDTRHGANLVQHSNPLV